MLSIEMWYFITSCEGGFSCVFKSALLYKINAHPNFFISANKTGKNRRFIGHSVKSSEETDHLALLLLSWDSAQICRMTWHSVGGLNGGIDRGHAVGQMCAWLVDPLVLGLVWEGNVSW